MDMSIAAAVLQVILSIIPQITSSKSINSIVSTLTRVIPIAVKGEQELLPTIENIIAALSSNPATTAAQLAALKVLDAQVDAAFDDAVAAYMAAHRPT
jgi:hypothetical protein